MHTKLSNPRKTNRNAKPAPVKKGAAAKTDFIHELADLRARFQAVGKVQAIVEFQTDGTILTANDNFLKLAGCVAEDLQGKNYSLFLEHAFRDPAEQQHFWSDLAGGKFRAKEFKHLAKGGREVWIQASHNPVFDDEGKAYKVVCVAVDITERKKHDAQLAELKVRA